ncbi:unnamed protein product [Linum trigynum]|uniref:tRNA-intron lyase n=1 Tax=Linum trigynum TaxID=586398 RepID=A0AAV2EK53_9ROSI
MSPRWKGKTAEAKALADPMSKIVSDLQSSLLQSDAHASLSGSSVLLPAEPQRGELLTRACFGRPIITADKENQWFQLSLEEAFYLCHHLQCLKITHHQGTNFTTAELWRYMTSKVSNFPQYYKAYSHLRTKNWVVRPGSQYGVDFVAYRHHPSLVHSEYAVLVLSEGESGGDDGLEGRLMVWSDLYCTIRLCGSVAKTLLVLTVNKNGHDAVSPMDLDGYSVEERSIRRWSAEQNREDQMAAAANGPK